MNNKIIFLIIFILYSVEYKVQAQGEILITPSRIVFNPKKNKEILNLLNTGKKSETYLVSFVQKRMNENGSFTEVKTPDPGENFASPHLRIYPRRITLKPGEGQVVMLQRRRNNNLQTGEYRSHLYFRSTTDYSALGETKIDSVAGVSVQLIPVFGMTIPIIFRSGKVNTTVTLTDLKLKNTKDSKNINFTLNRSGNSSIYGDMTVQYMPLKGNPITIAAINGVAIYTTINRRFMSINVIKKPSINYEEGKIKIIYKSRQDNSKQEVFATSTLNLSN